MFCFLVVFAFCKVELDVSFYKNLIDSVPGQYKRYWEWFFAFSQVPRQSWNHKYAAPQIRKWLLEMGLPESSITIDGAPNVLARIPASPGLENSPSVCLQAHMDVALHYTAEKLPYKVNLVNDWFIANESLLGADDGVGTAWQLLTAEERDEFKHGPIELLFTSDEEVGLVGMDYLPGPENLTHGLRSKSIINIDFFDSDKMAISSAGSIRFELNGKRNVSKVSKDTHKRIDFSVLNMIGGHSGMNMINGRPTPHDWCSRMLAELIENDISFRIGYFITGDSYNVLPVNGKVSIAVSKDNANKAESIISATFANLQLQYAALQLSQATYQIKSQEIEEDYVSLNEEDSVQLVDSVINMFHGVLYYVVDAIYTSQNVARVVFNATEEKMSFHVMPRTHIKGHLDYLRRRMSSFSRVFLFNKPIEHSNNDPWVGNQKANVFTKFREGYKHISGEEIKPVVFHAGIEAGKFQTRGYTDADVINFGADTINAHTIGEGVKVSTTNTKTDVLREFLKLFGDPTYQPQKPTPTSTHQPKNENSLVTILSVICISLTIIIVIIGFSYFSLKRQYSQINEGSNAMLLG